MTMAAECSAAGYVDRPDQAPRRASRLPPLTSRLSNTHLVIPARRGFATHTLYAIAHVPDEDASLSRL